MKLIERSALLTLLTPVLWSCSQAGRVTGVAEADLPVPQNFQLHLNHQDGAQYRSPLNGHWRNGDNLEDQLIQQIDTAKEEVLIAIQELTLP